MFQNVKNGWPIILESFQIFRLHPKLIAPLLLTWCIYAPLIIITNYLIDWDKLSLFQLLICTFGIILLYSFLLTFSCSVLMELIRQIEFGEEISIWIAIKDSFNRNFIALLPLIIFFSVIWFLILIIEAVISKFRPKEAKKLNYENVAKTLGNWDVFSWPRLLFYYFEKALRMIMFLIVPCVVWHDPNFFKGLKEAMDVFKSHAIEFITGFIVTEAATTIIFLPVTVLFILSHSIHLTDIVWMLSTIYIGLAWSYSLYLEQMYASQLYLWHRQWYKQVLFAKETGGKVPELHEVPKPSLLNGLKDLRI